MEVYLAVLSRKGGIPAELFTTVESLEELLLPFHPAVEHKDQWLSESGRTALWSWGNGPPAIPWGIAKSNRAAVCMSGYALESGSLVSADELLERTDHSDVDCAVARLGGVFSLARVEGDRILAWNTPARLEQV